MDLRRLWRKRRPRSISREAPEFYQNLLAIFDHENIDLTLDVGANEGQFSGELIEAGYRGPILSFEPLERPRQRLLERAAAHPGWTVAPVMALGAAPGEAEMFAFDRSDMSSLLPPTRTAHEAFPKLGTETRITVPVDTLDRQAAGITGQRLFLKIDAQGFELEILKGATALLPRLAVIQLEIGLTKIYDGQPGYLDLLNWAEQAGFEPRLFSTGYFSRRLNRHLDLDVVLCRK